VTVADKRADMRVHEVEPYNAEPPASALAGQELLPVYNRQKMRRLAQRAAAVRRNSDAALTGGSSKPGPLDKRSQALLAVDLDVSEMTSARSSTSAAARTDGLRSRRDRRLEQPPDEQSLRLARRAEAAGEVACGAPHAARRRRRRSRLDLTTAELPAEVELTSVALAGGASLTVPDSLRVEVSGLRASSGLVAG
jgi:hypothetical protein